MKLTHFEKVVITATRTFPEITVVGTVIGHRSPCGRFVVGITSDTISFAKLDPRNPKKILDPLRYPYESLEELEKYLEEFMEMYGEFYAREG